MKLLFFILGIASANCFFIDNEKKSKDKIVSGNFVDIEEVPYLASVYQYDSNLICGAAIIDKFWVLTAAHCTWGKTNLTIHTGTGNVGINRDHRYEIDRVLEHPEYNSRNQDNDIALIKLQTPIEFSTKEQPIGIAHTYDEPLENFHLRISGFGRISNRGDYSNMLKSAHVKVVNQHRCEIVYRSDPITNNMFCAGNGESDACQGDSGGPAVLGTKIYGIVSTGLSCGSARYPGVYTRVHLYYQWIVDQTGLVF